MHCESYAFSNALGEGLTGAMDQSARVLALVDTEARASIMTVIDDYPLGVLCVNALPFL